MIDQRKLRPGLLGASILCATIAMVIVTSERDKNYAAHYQDQERVIEDKLPKHVPIHIKMKREKESAFKDLQNEKWLGDFELEVTNTSSKPIYFLEIWLLLPDFINGDGRPDGFTLRCGRMEFIHFDTLALPTDVPIKPGETYTLKIPDDERRRWEQHKSERQCAQPHEG
jgi:hypothetical protein